MARQHNRDIRTVRQWVLLGSLVLTVCASLRVCRADDSANGSPAQTENKAPNEEASSKAEPTPMTLGACLAVAMANQPTIQAAQKSLAAGEIGRQALYHLPSYAERLSADLPFRRQQAERGMTLAVAEVQKAQQETIYDVTRLYYSYVYARQQEITARDIIEQMEIYYKVMEEILKSGVRDPKIKANQFTLYNLRDAIGEVQKSQRKAAAGKEAALGALREAMGMDETFAFVPSDKELPIMGGNLNRDQIVQFAVSRRPELAQAAAGVDVFRLEVCAQRALDGRFKFQAATFASGSDLHSKLIPLAVRTEKEYRPGAIAPEMPVSLAGRVEDRVARACALSQRQDVLYEKVLGLVRLEATNAFLNLQTASRNMQDAKTKFEQSRKVLEEARAAAALQQDPELLVRTEALAGKAQADYVEAVFDHLLALATLERVTAGAVQPAFPGRNP